MAKMEPPEGETVTAYDRSHLRTYLRLLDADAAGARWQDAAKTVLGVDPAADAERSQRIYASHLERARWLRDGGYLQLLQQRPD